jgi:hypothetical protein
MASAIASKSPVRRFRRAGPARLASVDIRSRLEQIELATVSSLRTLQMDIDGDTGVPSAVVLKKPRAERAALTSSASRRG